MNQLTNKAATSTRKAAALCAIACLVLVLAAALAYAPQKAHAAQEATESQSGHVSTQTMYSFLANKGGENIYQQGPVALQFELWTGYENNQYRVEVHYGDATGPCVASAEGKIYAMFSDVHVPLTLNVDTSDWPTGCYTIVIYNYYYSFGAWRESPHNPSTFDLTITENPALASAKASSAVTISTTKLTIKRGKSKMLSFSPKAGVTFKKASGNKKIKVTKKGKVKVAKDLKKGTYKIKVKAYKNGKVVAKKKVKVVVK